MKYDFINDFLSQNSEQFVTAAKAIHGFAELSLKEYKSCDFYCELLSKLGFTVTKGVCGVETAFTATYGSGSPKIAFLAEYDALAGLSQVGGITVKQEAVPGGNGHGCGHNMLGMGAAAAAYATMHWLKETGKQGTVVLVGCPGEEGGAAKAFMAKQNFFCDFDAAVTWHPGDVNTISAGGCNACIQTQYKFYGIAAHAAGCPEMGRSALDAVEMMNVGVQFLREHMPQNARIHYAITNSGGVSPNVVQPYASVLYMVRSPLVKKAVELQKRVDDIADGAALMSGCKVEKCFIDGTSDTIHNEVLCDVAYDALLMADAPQYTKAELDFAKAISETYGGACDISEYLPVGKAREVYSANCKQDGAYKAVLDFTVPHGDADSFSPGSTDVGDVSYQTPTVQVYTACFPAGAPGHSWQNVSCADSSFGYKGMIYAAKAMAITAAKLYDEPDTLAKAKSEFAVRTEGGFVSPIPDGAKPVVPEMI